MEERRGAIVDTCVPASRKLGALRTLNTKLYITPIVLLEYLNWALESRNLWLAEGDAKRTRGYERLVELLPSTLLELGIEVLEQKLTVPELREAASLVLQRGIDPGDALNAITARKGELGIITLDKDWQRLPDYVATIITL
ncbi:MAG: type II toxin-antitoxin system VapC family toxin [Thermofilum sp.]|nr:type II toxin-antitoxin system VapC family toxin [Thermofilum sp.]